MARDMPSYLDGDTVEGYCDTCHATLYVYVSVDVNFEDADVVCEEEDE